MGADERTRGEIISDWIHRWVLPTVILLLSPLLIVVAVAADLFKEIKAWLNEKPRRP
jgi:hypothetical protein